jgi:hypothetical protein
VSIFNDDGADWLIWGTLITLLLLGYVLWCIVHYGIR